MTFFNQFYYDPSMTNSSLHHDCVILSLTSSTHKREPFMCFHAQTFLGSSDFFAQRNTIYCEIKMLLTNKIRKLRLNIWLTSSKVLSLEQLKRMREGHCNKATQSHEIEKEMQLRGTENHQLQKERHER